MSSLKNYETDNKYLQLLSDLIFGDQDEYEIRIFEYINEYSEVEKFIADTTYKISKSGVIIVEDVLILKNKKQCWIIKINR